ncbi:MAG: lytic transglycosylase domain-containing protein [SAR324 cluster bacterium]|nr:lytic transglycosylase domain-containing protein [SAR324 cluster bacterium]
MRRIAFFGAAIYLSISIFSAVAFADSLNTHEISKNITKIENQKKEDALKTRSSQARKKRISKRQLKNVKRMIDRAIQKASELHDLSPSLIRALIQEESGGGVRGVYAVSKRNAKGLTQMMPSTAKEMGVRDPFDIEQNIIGGSGYLRKLLDKFGNIYLGLIAYNWGPRNTLRALRGQKHLPNSVKRYAGRIIDAIREA